MWRVRREFFRQDHGSERCGAIPALPTEPVRPREHARERAAGPAAIAEVVHDAVSEHVVMRLRFGDIERLLADYDRKLTFPVDIPVRRDDVGVTRIDDARPWRFGEEDRILLVRVGFFG